MNPFVALLASSLVVWASPASAASPDALRDLAGPWHCTYRAGSVRLKYDATWTYDRVADTLHQVVSFGAGGDEELLAYDAQHRAWSVVVFDAHGSTTVMRGTGGDAKHFSYRSVYPDTSIGVTYDRVNASEYTLAGRVRSGAKTIVSFDRCLRASR